MEWTKAGGGARIVLDPLQLDCEGQGGHPVGPGMICDAMVTLALKGRVYKTRDPTDHVYHVPGGDDGCGQGSNVVKTMTRSGHDRQPSVLIDIEAISQNVDIWP